MFGMATRGKQFFLLGNRRYRVVVVSGPIRRGGRAAAVQFDHRRRVLRVSKQIPAEQLPAVIANAVGDACFRLWRPVKVVWPKWEEEGRHG